VRVPWDSAHVFYVWYDALVNYITAIGYGQDPERFAKWWPAAHHLSGKDIIRFHCVWWPRCALAAGIDPRPLHRPWMAAGGGEKDVQDATSTRSTRWSLPPTSGVDALRYHLVRDVVLGSTGLHYEG